MSSDVDVVVIGAGAAGLSAAKEAERLSLSHKVLEASDRIGGRAYSEEIAPGVLFDHGCAWLHQAEVNPFVPIADKLGFTVGRKFGDSLGEGMSHLWRDGRLRVGEDAKAFWRYASLCDEAVGRAAKEGRDISITEVMDLERSDAALYLLFLSLSIGQRADLSSLVDFAKNGEGKDWPVRETYGSLVARWGSDVEVSLETKVKGIDWGGKLIRVKTNRGVLQCRSALVTISTGVLAHGGIDFEPRLPNWKIDAIHALPTGPVNKIAVHFAQDVWGKELHGLHLTQRAQGEPACFDFNVFGFPVAVVFTGGRFGEELEQEGKSASEAYGIECLVDVLGSDIRRHVNRTIATAWISNPLTRGAYSSALPGQAHQRKEMARSIDHRLFFAGEATIEQHQATAHGAYMSGIRAMGEINVILSSQG